MKGFVQLKSCIFGELERLLEVSGKSEGGTYFSTETAADRFVRLVKQASEEGTPAMHLQFLIDVPEMGF